MKGQQKSDKIKKSTFSQSEKFINFINYQKKCRMDFLKRNVISLKKKTMQWAYPNQNPTDIDKYAFNLLDKAEVDLFIGFMDKNDVNLNVMDYKKSNLLIKAQGIPTYRNAHTKLLSEEELEDRAIKAIDYLIKRGIDINYRDKDGATALLSACHWGYNRIVEFLLQKGADPNFGSENKGFQTNPLLSAAYKNHKEIVELLLLYGADPSCTEQINKTTLGWRLTQESLAQLYSQYNIVQLTKRRHIALKMQKNTILTSISERLFDEILLNA